MWREIARGLHGGAAALAGQDAMPPPAKPASAARGFVEHTDIRRSGVTKRVLKRWPDKVGLKIDPFRDDAAAMAA